MDTVSVTPGISPTARGGGLLTRAIWHPLGRAIGANKVKSASVDADGNFVPAVSEHPTLDAIFNAGQGADYSQAVNDVNTAQKMNLEDNKKRAIINQLLGRANELKVGAAPAATVGLSPNITAGDASTITNNAAAAETAKAKILYENELLASQQGKKDFQQGITSGYLAPTFKNAKDSQMNVQPGGMSYMRLGNQNITAGGMIPTMQSRETVTPDVIDPTTGLVIKKGGSIREQIQGGTDPWLTIAAPEVMAAAAKQPTTKPSGEGEGEGEGDVSVTPGFTPQVQTPWTINPYIAESLKGTGGIDPSLLNPLAGQQPVVDVAPSVGTTTRARKLLGGIGNVLDYGAGAITYIPKTGLDLLTGGGAYGEGNPGEFTPLTQQFKTLGQKLKNTEQYWFEPVAR